MTAEARYVRAAELHVGDIIVGPLSSAHGSAITRIRKRTFGPEWEITVDNGSELVIRSGLIVHRPTD